MAQFFICLKRVLNTLFSIEKNLSCNAQIDMMSEKTLKIKDERSRVGNSFVKRSPSGVFSCFKSVLKYP